MTLTEAQQSQLKKLGELLIVAALVLMVGRFVTQTYARMLTNSNSSDGDQGAFLQLSLDLREHGQLTDGTRSPLYAAVLAVIARRDWSFFTWAKLISMAFGVLAIVALYLLASRYFNRFTGLAAAYLLSINVEFIVHSATALTESLLVLLFILAWFAMLKALDEPQRPRYWLLAGLLAGLAYLAKGSGQLLVFAFLATAVLFFRGRLLQSKNLWLFVGGYILVASPLWLYNSVHYGSPTFNYAITHQMWMDSWNDWHPDDTANLPTLASYLQTHSAAEIFERQWAGMRAMRNILIKTLWPTRTLKMDEFLLSPVSGYTLALVALLPFIFWPATRTYLRRYGRAACLTLLTVAIFFVLFAWYVPIVALGQRFMLPVIPFIFVGLAHITGQIGQSVLSRGRWAKQAVLAAVVIVVLLQLRWAALTTVEPARAALAANVFEVDRHFNTDAATPLAWLVDQSPPQSVVAWGPAGKSLPTWAFSDRFTFKRYPPRADSISALTTDFVNRGVDFVIIAPEMMSRYGELFAPYFETDGTRVELAAFPPGWALTYAYRQLPCDWCVFRLLPNNPPQYAADYQIGPAMTLTGYDLPSPELKAGETLHLTLHWAAHAPIEPDFTVFTQLLGPDFQLHGQLDNQPLNNLWPTSRWQPVAPLADTYAIPIDAHAPPGVYQLLVGMYDGQTGQRQPVTFNGAPVADNAIPLATVTVIP